MKIANAWNKDWQAERASFIKSHPQAFADWVMDGYNLLAQTGFKSGRMSRIDVRKVLHSRSFEFNFEFNDVTYVEILSAWDGEMYVILEHMTEMVQVRRFHDFEVRIDQVDFDWLKTVAQSDNKGLYLYNGELWRPNGPYTAVREIPW